MPISADDKLGPYEILTPLDEGGMGPVCTARDTGSADGPGAEYRRA